jgi:hypothetical protein
MQAVAGTLGGSERSTSHLTTDLTARRVTPADMRSAMNLAAQHSAPCKLLGAGFSGGTVRDIAAMQRDLWQLGENFPLPQESSSHMSPPWTQRKSSMRKRGREVD